MVDQPTVIPVKKPSTLSIYCPKLDLHPRQVRSVHPSQEALPRISLIISSHGIIRQSSDMVGNNQDSSQSGNEGKGKQGMPIYDANTWEAEAGKISNSRLA